MIELRRLTRLHMRRITCRESTNGRETIRFDGWKSTLIGERRLNNWHCWGGLHIEHIGVSVIMCSGNGWW